ncbi:MAG: hypothetical protein D6702_11205 [Planctomycetota bacterium]|nr:MAG: hypothetical protein D6702_11205 [Planctomycetota bacterium]
MRIRHHHWLGLFGLLLLALPLLAAGGQDPSGHEEEETPLARQMHVMEEGLKFLRRSIRDPERNQESLAALLRVQAAAQAAKTEAPRMAAGLAEAERPAFVLAYRRGIIGVQRAFLDLEEALLTGDNDHAREVFARIRDLAESGHERFTEE